jgi:hypothetical protein
MMNQPSPDPGSLSSPDRRRGRPEGRLCIVARNHPLLFGYLTTLFRDRPPDAERIELVIDRRHDAAPKAPEVERRSSSIGDELRRRGFAFVAEPGKKVSPRDAARTERIVEALAGVEEHSWPFRRRRRRRIWQRIWGRRGWRSLGILAAGVLISTLLAAEFRMNELLESNIFSPRPSRLAPDQVAAPRPPAVDAAPATRADSAPAELALASAASSERAAAPTPPGALADRQRVPDPAFSARPQMAAETRPRSLAGAMEARPAEVPRPSLPDRASRVAAKSAPRVEAPAQETPEVPAAPMVAPSDLRIELSRKPTSVTGGGVVFLVRVSDLTGQPLSDAEVSMLAGRRPGGALFETRLYPTERPGTYQSGVIHPSTLPPDLTVKAIAGNRRVEAPVER